MTTLATLFVLHKKNFFLDANCSRFSNYCEFIIIKIQMGIQCLLQTLKSIQTKISISKYAGSTIGMDTYCWLHKGIHSCLGELAWNKPTTK